jgi:hypothetical protein
MFYSSIENSEIVLVFERICVLEDAVKFYLNRQVTPSSWFHVPFKVYTV